MLAIREVINIVVHMGLFHAIIESDSKVAIDSITGKIQAPKEIVNMVQDIKSLARNVMSVCFVHCY